MLIRPIPSILGTINHPLFHSLLVTVHGLKHKLKFSYIIFYNPRNSTFLQITYRAPIASLILKFISSSISLPKICKM